MDTTVIEKLYEKFAKLLFLINVTTKDMLKYHNTLVLTLVELLYALYEAGCFGKIPLKSLLNLIGQMLGCEITNCNRLFWDVRNHLGYDRTFFLNKL